MIVETFKLIMGIFPFVREAFLWRDGAEVGKPITEQNLLRRKIAVFVSIASIAINFIAITKAWEYRSENKKVSAEIQELKKQNEKLVTAVSGCAKPADMVAFAQQYCEHLARSNDQQPGTKIKKK
jgi:hypothetical protein